MRIIAGKLGGRKLQVFPAKQMRPTTDRVRESLFGALESQLDLEQCIAIDLYAGTASLGFEALSRGAQRAFFIEQDKRLCKKIEENAAIFGISDSVRVFCGHLPRTLESLGRELQDNSTRVFLIDPPYTAHPSEKVINWLGKYSLLREADRIVLGAPKKLDIDLSTADLGSENLSLEVQRTKTYGETKLRFMEVVAA